MQSTAKDLALNVFKAMNSRDFSILAPLTDDDSQLDFPGISTITGGKKLITFLKILM